MKYKVIILSCFLSPFRSGAESCAEEVAYRLSDEFDITVITARLSKKLPKEDVISFGFLPVRQAGAQGRQGKVPVVRVGLGYKFDKWLFPFLAPLACRRIGRGVARYAPANNTMLIHAVLETFAGLALHFCRFIVPSAKRLLTLQTTNRSFLKKMIVRSPHRVTAISSALSDISTGLGRNDVTIIPNGLNLAVIPHEQKIPGRILFVGRLMQWKGVDTLLTAFAAIHNKQQITNNAHLRIVGEGPERQSLEKLANDLGIADRVAFVGFVPIPEVYEEFTQAEIFCALSSSEALGNVFLEAQASGCAVIGTNIGGIVDIVEDEVTGLLVPPNNADAAERALDRLLSDRNLRANLAEEGRKRAQFYDWREIAQRYKKVYSDMI